jgi:hypothetical protein
MSTVRLFEEELSFRSGAVADALIRPVRDVYPKFAIG